MPEELVVRHCSPTLAGIKTGNLFTCGFESEGKMIEVLRRWNTALVPKGVRLMLLRILNQRALIYVYRPEKLKKDLEDGRACSLLQQRGYPWDNPNRCVAQVACKLRSTSEFPHEIGLFLGYPPEDVEGFIHQGSRCCKCVGCWKVYGDADKAKRIFEKYKRCTAIYEEQWRKGKSVEQLTVAV